MRLIRLTPPEARKLLAIEERLDDLEPEVLKSVLRVLITNLKHSEEKTEQIKEFLFPCPPTTPWAATPSLSWYDLGQGSVDPREQ